MTYWLLPDTHLGHSTLVARGVRPPDYEARIRRQVHALVRPDDVLVHLGDVAFGPMDRVIHEEVIGWPGRQKWLCLGNHDRRGLGWYLARGWSWVGQVMTLKVFGEVVALSHHPLPRNGAWTLNVHGHCHVKAPKYTALGDPWGWAHELVALETTHYAPVGLQALVGRVQRRREEIGDGEHGDVDGAGTGGDHRARHERADGGAGGVETAPPPGPRG